MKRLIGAVVMLQMVCVASMSGMEENCKAYDYDPSGTVSFDAYKSGYGYSIPVRECGERYDQKASLIVPAYKKEKLTTFSKQKAIEIKNFYDTSIIRFGVKEVQEAAEKQNITDVVEHYTTSIKNLSFENAWALDSSLRMRGAVNYIVSKLEHEANISTAIDSYRMCIAKLSDIQQQANDDDYRPFTTLAKKAFGGSDTQMLLVSGISIMENTPFYSYLLAIPLIEAIEWVEFDELSKNNNIEIKTEENNRNMTLEYFNIKSNSTGFNVFMQVKKHSTNGTKSGFDATGFFNQKEWDEQLKKMISKETFMFDGSRSIEYDDTSYLVSIPVFVNGSQQVVSVHVDDMRLKDTGSSHRIKRATDGALVTLTFDKKQSFFDMQQYNEQRNKIYKLKKKQEEEIVYNASSPMTCDEQNRVTIFTMSSVSRNEGMLYVHLNDIPNVDVNTKSVLLNTVEGQKVTLAFEGDDYVRGIMITKFNNEIERLKTPLMPDETNGTVSKKIRISKSECSEPKKTSGSFFTTKKFIGFAALGIIGWLAYKHPKMVSGWFSKIPLMPFLKQVMSRFSK